MTNPVERFAAAVYTKMSAAQYRAHTYALRAQLRSGGASIHPTAVLGRFHFVGDPALLTIGKGAVVNNLVVLSAMAPLVIADDASISTCAQVHTAYLRPEGNPRNHGYAPVSICANAWIASGAIISAGVTIGRNSIVGAGSVVTKDVEPDMFVGGVPARVIRRLERTGIVIGQASPQAQPQNG